MKTRQTNPLMRSGFTLVELLVVITIIVVLASLVFLGAQRGMQSANKSRNVSQMREIGIAVATWAVEKNNGEPMYTTGGSDNSSETYYAGRDKNLCAGNPANLLYNKDNPGEGYVTNHATFFSPLHKWPVPPKEDYDSWKANPKNLWGTFIWVYPSVVKTDQKDDRTQRQLNAKCNGGYERVGREAYNNALMFNDYSVAKARYSSKLNYVLFRDGSVRQFNDVWGWFYGDK